LRPSGQAPKRYSPAKCIGCTSQTIDGTPDPAHVSTSYVKRANLTMRMGMPPGTDSMPPTSWRTVTLL